MDKEYTGENDRNGVKICNGDIVKFFKDDSDKGKIIIYNGYFKIQASCCIVDLHENVNIIEVVKAGEKEC